MQKRGVRDYIIWWVTDTSRAASWQSRLFDETVQNNWTGLDWTGLDWTICTIWTIGNNALFKVVFTGPGKEWIKEVLSRDFNLMLGGQSIKLLQFIDKGEAVVSLHASLAIHKTFSPLF